MQPTIDCIVRNITEKLSLSEQEKLQLKNVIVVLIKMVCGCCRTPVDGKAYLSAPRKFRHRRIERELYRQLTALFQDGKQHHKFIVVTILKLCKTCSVETMGSVYSEVKAELYERVDS